MHASTLSILRCSFCGGRLSVVDGPSVERNGDDIAAGVLSCECCAYPIVAGIPVMVADRLTETAMHQLEAGQADDALFTLLRLDGPRQDEFRRFVVRGDSTTYREGVDILGRHEEGVYFLYRFSDPTYLVAQTVLRAVGRNRPCVAGRTLDLCGGSGHLTRELCQMAVGAATVLADSHFWKIWLAKRFTAPSCEPICCDANSPLPFAGDTFSLVVCSDAFHYIWCKRLLAGDMRRVAGPDGTVVLTHLHSALGENVNAGMPLTPDGYRNLFEERAPRLFKDSDLLSDVIGRGAIDLGRIEPLEALCQEPSLTLIAGPHEELFRRYDRPELRRAISGELVVNPLYTIESRGTASVLTRAFPSPDYEEEYAACKRYLPATVTVEGTVSGRRGVEISAGDRADLEQHLVLIDVPKNYC